MRFTEPFFVCNWARRRTVHRNVNLVVAHDDDGVTFKVTGCSVARDIDRYPVIEFFAGET